MRIARLFRLVLIVFAVVTLPLVGCAPEGFLSATREPVTLRFAFRENTVDLAELFTAFQEEHPYITIETVTADRWGGDLHGLVQNSNIDIFRDGMDGLGLVEDGWLVPLDDIQLEGWAGIRDDYFEGIWEGLNVQGQQWGVPAGLDTVVAYVNTTQAKALALDVPDADWDLFEFLDLTTLMNFPEGLPSNTSTRLIGFCSDPASFSMDPVIFTYLHGGAIVDDLGAPSRATLDDPLTIEATQWYSDLANRYQVMPDAEQVRRLFRRGGVYEAQMRGFCGVWLGMYSMRGGLDTQYEWSFDWKMLPLPRDHVQMSIGQIDAYYITKNCTHRNEALMLLRYLSDHWQAAGQMLPPRMSLLESDEYELAVGEEIAEMVRQFSDKIIIIPGGMSPALQEVGAAYLTAVKQIVAQDLDAANVLLEAQDNLEDVFRE